MVDFLHHPDNATQSSHRMVTCEGKKSSWSSELFKEKSQSVMGLRDSKNHLYAKDRAECEASFTKVLNAGNFKEMLQMVGLCNICDEIGARN